MKFESDPNNELDVERIRTETSLAEVLFFERVGSTNDEAIRWVSDSANRCPIMALARNQERGRGQRQTSWSSGEGSLTFSLGLDTNSIHCRPTLIPLTVGVSLCQVIQQLGLDELVQIKWPNDVIIGRKKAGGILIETVGTNRVVIGIGLNVNNETAHIETRTVGLEGAISLKSACGKSIRITDLLIQCANAVCDNLAHQQAETQTLAAYDQRSLLSGCSLEIEQPDGQILIGRCMGFSPDGNLILANDNELEKPINVASGQIRRIEYPDQSYPA